MFFRRERPRVVTFEERLELLRRSGCTVAPEPGGGVRVSRDGCAAVIREEAGGQPRIEHAGVLMGGEIGRVVDGGFQKFLVTPGGRRVPALATQFKSLHAFEEDLWEALGLTSLYNQSLGTVNDSHMYDRVLNRDRGVPRRPWEKG